MKNIVLSVVFALFAALQLNDPDPWLWVLIYGVVALFALAVQFAPRLALNPIQLYTPILIYQIVLGVYALLYVPSLIEYIAQPNKIDLVGQMKTESPWIEGTRELLGLVIAVVALHFLKQPAKGTSGTDLSDTDTSTET